MAHPLPGGVPFLLIAILFATICAITTAGSVAAGMALKKGQPLKVAARPEGLQPFAGESVR